MATTTTRKPTTYPTIAEMKKVADERYNTGTRADRDALLYANGLRTAWEAKGYGRATVRAALGIEQATLWVWELVLPVGHPDHAKAVKAIAALPDSPAKVAKDAKAKAKADSKAKASAADLA